MPSNIFTQVHIHLFRKDSLCAQASLKVHDVLYLTGLRIVEGRNGIFVAMPNRKTADGEYQDVYFPANKAMHDELQAAVLEEYYKEVNLSLGKGVNENAD